MRISDWSSDVCSSDLAAGEAGGFAAAGSAGAGPGLDDVAASTGAGERVHAVDSSATNASARRSVGRMDIGTWWGASNSTRSRRATPEQSRGPWNRSAGKRQPRAPPDDDGRAGRTVRRTDADRKSTRLNS